MYLLNEIPEEHFTKEHLGGKGYGLAWMTKAGDVKVPPAVIIPTDKCTVFQGLDSEGKVALCKALADQVIAKGGQYLFTKYNPCVSVRSGARVSMPGMMDTILNVGITSDTWDDLADAIGEEAAQDSYRRLIEMFGTTVHGHSKEVYAEAHQEVLKMGGGPKALAIEFLEVYAHQEADGDPEFPDTIHEQLWLSIYAVFSSWGSERAREYRKLHSIPEHWGTAVVVQAMVFGNRDDQSCSGVMFSRNPSTGSCEVVGEYAVNAQGEDVVSGAVTPENIEKLQTDNSDLYWALVEAANKLENAAGDAQDIEFTVESGVLYILQTRTAKRTPTAHVRIAHDMCDEGTLNTTQALKRIPYEVVPALNVVTVAPGQVPAYTGLAAGGGAVVGTVCFNRNQLLAACANGQKAILVAPETTPDDFPEMVLASAILTSTGGITCHAAVVARGMNKTCVVGCAGVMGLAAGAEITLCGLTGRVYNGAAKLEQGSGLYYLEMLLAKHLKGHSLTMSVISPQGLLSDVLPTVPSCWEDPDSSHGKLALNTGAMSPEGKFITGIFNGVGGKMAKPATIAELMQLTAKSGTLDPSYVYTSLGGYDVLAKLQETGLVDKNLSHPALYLDEALEGLLG